MVAVIILMGTVGLTVFTLPPLRRVAASRTAVPQDIVRNAGPESPAPEVLDVAERTPVDLPSAEDRLANDASTACRQWLDAVAESDWRTYFLMMSHTFQVAVVKQGVQSHLLSMRTVVLPYIVGDGSLEDLEFAYSGTAESGMVAIKRNHVRILSLDVRHEDAGWRIGR
jgi:hypothetical protein